MTGACPTDGAAGRGSRGAQPPVPASGPRRPSGSQQFSLPSPSTCVNEPARLLLMHRLRPRSRLAVKEAAAGSGAPGPAQQGRPRFRPGAGLPAHGPPTAHPASPCAGRRDRLPGPPRQARSPGSRSPACRPSAPPQLSSCRLCHQCPLDRETTEAVTEQDTSESERGGGCERDAEATGADRHVPRVTASI